MNNTDWDDLLGIKAYGLVVEGVTDETIIREFLNFGQKSGHWQNWTSQLLIKQLEGKSNILDEMERDDNRIWGLIDRDAYSSSKLADLQQKYRRLLILPRWTIENYFIVPDELGKIYPDIQTQIESQRENWVQHGALWSVLQEQGIFEENYPRKLFDMPIRQDEEIRALLMRWQNQIEPDVVLNKYHHVLQSFRADRDNDFTQHIYGKVFFKAIVKPLLDQYMQNKDGKIFNQHRMKENLLMQFGTCPADLIPVLRRVVK